MLLDTSALVHLARGNSRVRDRLSSMLDEGSEFVVCEPVAMEFLAGLAPNSIGLAERILNSFRSVPIDPNADFRAAAYMYSTLAAVGRKPRDTLDCLIATAAIAADATVLHVDRDFEAIATVSELRQERLAVA